jgi:hypothetical protein
MLVKHSLYAAGLALPLLLAAAAPSAALGSRATAEEDVGVATTDAEESDIVTDEGDVTMDEQVVEPTAAEPEPTGCVKTNVKNFKNACPQ